MSIVESLDQERQLNHLLKRVKNSTSPKIERILTEGDICTLYLCSWTEMPEPLKESTRLSRWDIIGDNNRPKNTEKKAVMKVCRNLSDNDLTQNEARIASLLYPLEQKDEGFYRYLCKPLSFEVEIAQPLLIFPYLENYISFEDILKTYPQGIDYRDMAWMLRRLLEAIGFVHRRGVVHGAVLPPHFMIHPVKHGGKLIDWSYAVTDHASIKAISARWRDYYPSEVFAKRFPDARTDIYMAAKCAVALLGGNVKTNEMPDRVPKQIQTFLRSCLGEMPSSRPHSAWNLHDEFESVLFKLIGKPKYRKFQ